jgi:calcium binding protein
MPKIKDPKREERILDEITLDANGPEEQAMGWYNYLEEKLGFPFTAICIAERAISPLRKGDEVEIVGMAAEEECEHEMFVETPWERRRLAIPLAQIKPIQETDAATKEAVEDWHYWVKQGYQL